MNSDAPDTESILFRVDNQEENYGEGVRECYYYLDNSFAFVYEKAL